MSAKKVLHARACAHGRVRASVSPFVVFEAARLRGARRVKNQRPAARECADCRNCDALPPPQRRPIPSGTLFWFRSLKLHKAISFSGVYFYIQPTSSALPKERARSPTHMHRHIYRRRGAGAQGRRLLSWMLSCSHVACVRARSLRLCECARVAPDIALLVVRDERHEHRDACVCVSGCVSQ
jgi:hypothetical protein